MFAEHSRRAAIVAVLAASIGLCGGPTPAHAQPTDAQRTAAQELLDQARATFARGDVDDALRIVMRARTIHASAKSALFAATCFVELARIDEAYDMFEEAGSSPSELDDAERQTIARARATLAPKVGLLQVSAPRGVLLVDGVVRGKLPLTAPIHAIAGTRWVRVVADDAATFDEAVEVRSGESANVDAPIVAIAGAGTLRVEGTGTVFVDGAPRGQAPWEGAASPGTHAAWIESDAGGSAPIAAIVRTGATTIVRAPSAPLAATTHVDIEPATARLAIDDVDVGNGGWLGRLPVGTHTLRATEAGYVTAKTVITVNAGGAPTPIVLRLPIDPAHPRWPKPSHAWSVGWIRVGLHAGPAFGATLSADAERPCPKACPTFRRPLGVMIGARGGVELPSGVSLELDLGAMHAAGALVRREGGYIVLDSPSVGGPYFTVGASFERRVLGPIAILTRLGIGGVIASTKDDIAAAALAGTSTRTSHVASGGESVTSFAPFVLPNIGASARLGRAYVSLSLGAIFATSRGPALPTGAVSTRDFPDSSVLVGERGYGPFVLWVPQIEAGYGF